MPIATLADVEALERIPFSQRCADPSVFDALVATGRRHGDKVALRFLAEGRVDEPSRDITYGQFARRLIQAANLFRSLGAGPDDAVSLLLPISPETFVAMFGAQGASVANPINFFLETDHIVGLLTSARTRILLGPDPDLFPGIWHKVEAVRAAVPGLAHVIRVGGPASRPEIDALHFETELDRQPGDAPTFSRTFAPGETASLFHTGGTTSAPKLARHTHRGLLLQAWSNAQALAPGSDQVYFNGLPPFHVGGGNCAGLMPLLQGAEIVLLTPAGYRNPAVMKNLWAFVERFRATMVGMVPTSWGTALGLPSDGHDLSSLRLAQSGGSSMAPELLREVRAKLGVPVVEGWGMTELHGFGSMNPVGGECRPGSVGLRTPYTEIVVAGVQDGRIVDICATGTIGHVLVRGEQVFGGYTDPTHDADAWVEPLADESRPAWSRGGRWLDTGDLGRFDDEGYLWLTGRAKDIIIRSGHNLDPVVIEEALHEHPAVEAAAAVGRPDAYAGELPVGFVQLKPGAEATPEEIVSFVRERIPERAAVPVEIVVLPQMPLTAVGKIFKPQLRYLAAQLTLERLIRALVGESVPVSVAVGPHPQHGSFASVHLAGHVPDEDLASVRQTLAPLQLRHEVVVDPAPLQ